MLATVYALTQGDIQSFCCTGRRCGAGSPFGEQATGVADETDPLR
jgi:hypothetical protein